MSFLLLVSVIDYLLLLFQHSVVHFCSCGRKILLLAIHISSNILNPVANCVCLSDQHGPCSVALGQSPPSWILRESHPQERPGGVTQPQGVSPPKALGSQDRLLARWAGSMETALTSGQLPPLGCGQAPPLAADRSQVHVGLEATGSLVWLTHNPVR